MGGRSAPHRRESRRPVTPSGWRSMWAPCKISSPRCAPTWSGTDLLRHTLLELLPCHPASISYDVGRQAGARRAWASAQRDAAPRSSPPTSVRNKPHRRPACVRQGRVRTAVCGRVSMFMAVVCVCVLAQFGGRCVAAIRAVRESSAGPACMNGWSRPRLARRARRAWVRVDHGSAFVGAWASGVCACVLCINTPVY
jgi:hypothetical protein